MARQETFEVIQLVGGKKALKQTVTETKEEVTSTLFTFDELQKRKTKSDADSIEFQRLIDQAVSLNVDKP